MRRSILIYAFTLSDTLGSFLEARFKKIPDLTDVDARVRAPIPMFSGLKAVIDNTPSILQRSAEAVQETLNAMLWKDQGDTPDESVETKERPPLYEQMTAEDLASLKLGSECLINTHIAGPRLRYSAQSLTLHVR